MGGLQGVAEAVRGCGGMEELGGLQGAAPRGARAVRCGARAAQCRGGLRVSSAAERRGTAVRGVGGLISSGGGLSPVCGGYLLCGGPPEATGASPHLRVGFGVPPVWMQLGAALVEPPALVGAISGRPGGSRVISFPSPRVAGATILWQAT